MGTDAIICVERRIRDGWARVSEDFAVARSYRTFAVLGLNGAMLGVAPVAEARGLPKDMSTETRKFLEPTDNDLWRGDKWGFGDSYLTLTELLTYQVEYPECCSELDLWTEIVPRLVLLGNSDDVRIVYKFNN